MAEEVFMFNNDAPEMQAAYRRARETFRHFWREQFWEYRRIIPGLTLASVKLPFSDGELTDSKGEVEHMWVNEIDFDGRHIHGKLINDPNWLKSVKVGDEVKVPIGAISDWMYALDKDVYGAFSVNVMRAQMDRKERSQHDNAWGLDFGDPESERLFPIENGAGKSTAKPGLFQRIFGSNKAEPAPIPETSEIDGQVFRDHPMGANMVEKYEEQLATDPGILRQVDDIGWTQLHHHSLAGNMGIVKLFLKLGADPEALTPEGVSAAALARVLGWDEVAEVIEAQDD